MAVYYMNAPAPYVIEENFGDYFYDHDDSSLAEVLQDQEIVYESIQRTGQSGTGRGANLRSNPSNGQNLRERVGASRSVRTDDGQLAVDEAIAKELQDLENQLLDVSIRENNVSNSGRVRPVNSTAGTRSTINIPVEAPSRQDDIDPDSMTYEELQELGEAMGTESRGLSDQMIAYLPTCNYKIGGIFSRKDKHEECVICCMAYKNKDKLIILPCEHKYHKDCVTKWLKINKTCPVCGKEVFGS
ncbi:hypothetical protein LUZ60_016407 [Juncus effusus]|nr:hypothetical protein LUZ60_016407 [Juncus effusus]